MIILEHWNNKVLHSERLGGTRMKAVSTFYLPTVFKDLSEHPTSLCTGDSTTSGESRRLLSKEALCSSCWKSFTSWDISVSLSLTPGEQGNPLLHFASWTHAISNRSCCRFSLGCWELCCKWETLALWPRWIQAVYCGLTPATTI